MTKRIIGNTVATLLAIGTGFFAMWASEIMKRPELPIDWVVLILLGITAGTLVFFIAWGHFQNVPIPPDEDATKQA